MPIYEYTAVAEGCAHCRARFEVRQKLGDAELGRCPKCGAQVQRVLSAPSVTIGNSHVLRESNVDAKGFTQYRRAGKGVYEKTAGKGPKYISGD